MLSYRFQILFIQYTKEIFMSKMRSNNVALVDSSGYLSSISYVPNSLVISQGKSAKPPPTFQRSGNTFNITLEAEREKTSSVANAFNNACGGKSHEYAPDGNSTGVPEELNFYFAVTINLQTPNGATSVVAYLGQGSHSSNENWWIGGQCIESNNGKPKLIAQVGNVTVSIPLSGNDDTFKLAHAISYNTQPVKHVFVLMLENHSFDNMLAMSGIPGIRAATTANFNTYNGQQYHVRRGAPASMPSDPGHEFPDVAEQLSDNAQLTQYNPYPTINNGGYVKNYATSISEEGHTPSPQVIGDVMAAFDTPVQLPILQQLASEFTLCDQWFSSLPGPTWPNRYFVHGASSAGLDHSPSGLEMTEWETVRGFKYPNGSIYDKLNESSGSWRLYNDFDNDFAANPGIIDENGGSIAQVSSIHNLQMWDVRHLHNFAADLHADYNYQYTFIEPNYGDVALGDFANGSSQHPRDDVYGGEGLIKYVYESIRNSPLWKDSLLFITYDEHGGFYDSVTPPTASPPNDNSSSKLNEFGFTFAQLGVRVPAVVVSPWVASGVDHTVYDHSSVLATVEKLFGLPALTDRDANANNITHLFLSQARTDCPTLLTNRAPPKVSMQTVRPNTMQNSLEALPDNGYLQGVLGIALKHELVLSDGTEATKRAIISRFKQLKTRGDAKAYLQEVMAKVEIKRVALNN
jgi:phospholipase C